MHVPSPFPSTCLASAYLHVPSSSNPSTPAHPFSPRHKLPPPSSLASAQASQPTTIPPSSTTPVRAHVHVSSKVSVQSASASPCPQPFACTCIGSLSFAKPLHVMMLAPTVRRTLTLTLSALVNNYCTNWRLLFSLLVIKTMLNMFKGLVEWGGEKGRKVWAVLEILEKRKGKGTIFFKKETDLRG